MYVSAGCLPPPQHYFVVPLCCCCSLTMHKIWIEKQRSLGTTNNGNNGAVQRFLHLFFKAGHTYVFKIEDGDENGCEL